MNTWLSPLFIAALLALTAVFANAQQSAKIPRIGYLNTHVYPSSSLDFSQARRLMEPFQEGLRELGYIEGQNIIIDARIGKESEFPYLAAELVRLKVDVIVAQPRAIAAAIGATATIPIVAVFPGDPVASGNVASLDRPKGNVTGIGGLTLGLGGKWLELIKETIPSANRVVVFYSKSAEERFPVWRTVDSLARSLGVDLKWEEDTPRPSPTRGAAGSFYERLKKVDVSQSDAFIALPLSNSQILEAIALFGLRNRIPGIFWRTDLDLDQLGGLMAYGVSRSDQSRRAAYFVDKILKGAKPAELPVELPKKFELVVNLKTAKEIGITIPPRVLAWADKVIK